MTFLLIVACMLSLLFLCDAGGDFENLCDAGGILEILAVYCEPIRGIQRARPHYLFDSIQAQSRDVKGALPNIKADTKKKIRTDGSIFQTIGWNWYIGETK